MGNTLTELYRSIEKNVKTVYVFPDIEKSSKYNPYLKLLYQSFFHTSEKEKSIHCKSPHPLLPWFIVRKIFGEKSIVHYHWLHFIDFVSFLIVLWKLTLLAAYKGAGGKIVWTVHNKKPHVTKFVHLNLLFRRLIARMAFRIHVHNPESVSAMAPVLHVSRDKFFVVNHPEYPVTLTEKTAATHYLLNTMALSLDIEKPVFIMYGGIASYKDIITVISLFLENNQQLLIAGKCKKGEESYVKEIKKLIHNMPNIFLVNRFVLPHEEQYLFGAADCAIFNFKEMLSSGSIMLALSYKKDVIIPDTECTMELSGSNIHKFNSPTGLKKQIDSVAAHFKK